MHALLTVLAVCLGSLLGSDDSLDDLVRGLKDKKAAVRVQSAAQIGELGKKGSDAARDLCIAMLDKDPRVQIAAGEALGRVRPDISAHVVTLVTDNNRANLIQAASDLAQMKATARPATPVLIARIRLAIAQARTPVGRRKGDGGSVGSSILRPYLHCLGQICGNNPEAIQVLQGVATSGEHGAIAVEQLAFIAEHEQSAKKPIIKSLIALLASQNNDVCAAAATALGDFGADARAAISALERLKLHRNSVIRAAAAEAVTKIGEP